jgi:hypothetical protein
MTPKQEVAALGVCRELNKRFGPPKNPAWWWVRVNKTVMVHGWALWPLASEQVSDVPAWTLANTIELCGRKTIFVDVTGPITSTPGLMVKGKWLPLTATNFARAILAAGGSVQ